MHATKIMVAVLGLWLGGCAIHPLPQDVTGYTTYDIIQKIRCETRDALTQLAVRGLRESNNPRTLALADRLERADRLDTAPGGDRINIIKIFEDPALARDVDRLVHNNFDIMALSAIAFDFTFTGTENNDAGGSAGFRYPLFDGTSVFTLGVSAGSARQRQNERQLQVGHTFIELYTRTDRDICRAIAAGTGNYVYPITGKIGLGEVINTFYLLNRPHDKRLKSPSDDRGEVNLAYQNDEDGGDVMKLSETLEFTTAVNAGATPSVSVEPVPGPYFRLAEANLNLAARRSDVHKVVVTLTKGRKVASLAQAQSLAGLFVAAVPLAREAKKRAFQRLDDLRTQDFFKSQREIRQKLGLPPL